MSKEEEEKKYIRADAATALLLDKMLSEIRQLSSDVKKQMPEGVVEPLRIITATTTQQTITPPMHKPWFSVSIVNDGPDDCWIIVNSEKSSTSPSLVRVGEPCEIDFGVPLIEDLVVWTDSGTATLRIRGVR